MQIHRDLEQLPQFKNTVLTIGSFDGVHIGHQHILRRLRILADELDGESLLVTFHPHPRIVLSPEEYKLQLLTTIEEKADLLAQQGLDHLVLTPFTKAFSVQSPEAYIEDFLIQQFQPRCIVIGYDHRFGKNRQGDISYLRQYQEPYDFEIEEITKQEIEHIAISSTKVRNALSKGKIRKATQLLGHPFRLTGKVVKGNQIGRNMGFPTANVEVPDPHKLIPPVGIYAVQVVYKEQRYGGMLYIGARPTIGEALQQTIEVNIFDFNQNIYGELLRVDFIAHIRGDSKFEGLEALRVQLQADRKAALAALKMYSA